jgi:hypothetical protein
MGMVLREEGFRLSQAWNSTVIHYSNQKIAKIGSDGARRTVRRRQISKLRIMLQGRLQEMSKSIGWVPTVLYSTFFESSSSVKKK